jgi:hypothetical protein
MCDVCLSIKASLILLLLGVELGPPAGLLYHSVDPLLVQPRHSSLHTKYVYVLPVAFRIRDILV